MTKVTINGTSFSFEGDQVAVISKNGIITANGTVIASNQAGEVHLTVEGGVVSIDAGGSVHCANVNGDVDAGGSVNCGHVSGNVDAGGSVSASTVAGRVDAGGSVRIGSR